MLLFFSDDVVNPNAFFWSAVAFRYVFFAAVRNIFNLFTFVPVCHNFIFFKYFHHFFTIISFSLCIKVSIKIPNIPIFFHVNIFSSVFFFISL